MTPATTIVSVVFEAERDLQLLQARSLDRFASEDLVDRVLVLDNSRRPAPASWHRQLHREAGRWAERLEVVRTADLSTADDAPGWVRQQAAKLAVSARIATDSYLVLDAKNHLVAPFGPADLVGPAGRWQLRRVDYRTHPLRPKVERVLQYLDLDPRLVEHPLPGTTTPYVFDTGEVRALWSWLERTSGTDPASAFVAEGLIEFALYGLWLLREGRLDTVHDSTQIPTATLWPRHRELDDVAAVLATAGTSLVLGAHRSALVRMSPAARAQLVEFWLGTGLFTTAREARAFLDRARRRILRDALSARLPGRSR